MQVSDVGHDSECLLHTIEQFLRVTLGGVRMNRANTLHRFLSFRSTGLSWRATHPPRQSQMRQTGLYAPLENKKFTWFGLDASTALPTLHHERHRPHLDRPSSLRSRSLLPPTVRWQDPAPSLWFRLSP